MKKTITWFATIFEEQPGKVSSHRIFLAVLIGFLMTWSSLIVEATKKIPEIPESWVFIILIFAGGVSASKGINAWQTMKGQGNGPQQAV